MGTIEDLINGLKAGSQWHLARAINIIEKDGPESELLLSRIYGEVEKFSPLIGITGFGGAGKSSLVGVVAEYLLDRGKKVGVLAVDPTSPRSGGSILGDRIRLQHLFPNENLFFRSYANKGAFGGLSPVLMESVRLLEFAGFDYIFLETVGIGQSEVDISSFADVVVLVLSPGLGDEIQFLKGGIMELADVFVMNKMDMPNANISLAALEAYARLLDEPPPIIPTSALLKENVVGVVEAIERVYTHKAESGVLDKVRQSRREVLYVSWVEKMLKEVIAEQYRPDEVPYRAAADLVKKIRRCLREAESH
ncbi:methylmalonyl Co-A mutase-associated GTPase MeaB [Coprothermobacteraceae bacterium]|nr:methylmalonyl Co-A mutase-associated GTPase MeaB [Coprothermobacteraceae bacterium]